MRLSSLLACAALGTVSAIASADAARSYATLDEALRNNASFNCSGINARGTHIQVHVDQGDGKVVAAQIARIVSGKTVNVIDLNERYTPYESSVKRDGQKVVMHAEYINDGYFSAILNVELRDSPQGILGTLSFDDGDGIFVDSDDLTCSALNRIVIP